MRDLSSLTRDWTWLPAAEVQSLNHWTAREFPSLLLCMGRCKSRAHWNHSLGKHLSYGASALRFLSLSFLKLHLWGRVWPAGSQTGGVFVSFLGSLRAHHRGWLQLLIAGHPLFTATAGITAIGEASEGRPLPHGLIPPRGSKKPASGRTSPAGEEGNKEMFKKGVPLLHNRDQHHNSSRSVPHKPVSACQAECSVLSGALLLILHNPCKGHNVTPTV